MLTKRQRDVLVFVHRRIYEMGYAPSFDEIIAGCGFKSKSEVHRILGILEERGFVRRLHRRARAIEVIRVPDDLRVKMRAMMAEAS